MPAFAPENSRIMPVASVGNLNQKIGMIGMIGMGIGRGRILSYVPLRHRFNLISNAKSLLTIGSAIRPQNESEFVSFRNGFPLYRT